MARLEKENAFLKEQLQKQHAKSQAQKDKITVTDDEVGRAVIERARQMPGREKEVWDYYRNNANALRPAPCTDL